jgi:ABC-type lipoprotein release transport system permease subunit
MTYTTPWVEIIGIGALAYAASLLTTYLPARQASKVYPAEALRYE